MSQDNKPRKYKCYACDTEYDEMFPDCPRCGDRYALNFNEETFDFILQENAKLKEQVKVMREALEFYADGSNWEHISPHKAEYRVIEESDMGDGNFQITQMTDDEWVGGKRARATLEKVGR